MATATAVKKAARRLNELTATEIVAAVQPARRRAKRWCARASSASPSASRRSQAWQFLDSGAGARPGARARPQRQARPARRRAIRHQGHHRHLRHADRVRHRRYTRATGPRATRRASRSARKAGGVVHGQDGHHRVRERSPGQDAQSARPARTPGGSSSGSAAAVGDSRCRSRSARRRPARRSGRRRSAASFGYRPTWGDLRCAGVMEARARSTRSDSSRARSRTSRSIATCCSARDPEPTAAEVPAPRIGFCRTHFWAACSSPRRSACSRTPREARRARARR